MKLSLFTTITKPTERGDLFTPSLACYTDLADEVVIVNGATTRLDESLYKVTYARWPREFTWPLIGQHFQRGYEVSSGDWVIHADLDFIFHERDFATLRNVLEANNNAPALNFYKYQFIQPDRYNLKSRLVIAVNKGKYGDRIRFDSGRDLCQPSLDGNELKPNDVPESHIAIYNYEKILKTEPQVKDDCGRMARAWERHFGEFKLGGPDDESAYNEWLAMVVGRSSKPHKKIALNEHPKYIHETIKNLSADHWGYEGFGYFERNSYA